MIDPIDVVIGLRAHTNGTANIVSSPVVIQQEGNVYMNNFNNNSNNDDEEIPQSFSIVSLGSRAHGVYPLSLLDSSFNASTKVDHILNIVGKETGTTAAEETPRWIATQQDLKR